MATKWKNSIKETGVFLKSHKIAAAGLLAAVLGLVCFYALFRLQGMMNTQKTWMAGIVCNLFISAATMILLPLFIERLYRGFVPENGDFYEKWKAKSRHQQQIICTVFAFLFLMALIFFSIQIRYGLSLIHI